MAMLDRYYPFTWLKTNLTALTPPPGLAPAADIAELLGTRLQLISPTSFMWLILPELFIQNHWTQTQTNSLQSVRPLKLPQTWNSKPEALTGFRISWNPCSIWKLFIFHGLDESIFYIVHIAQTKRFSAFLVLFCFEFLPFKQGTGKYMGFCDLTGSHSIQQDY